MEGQSAAMAKGGTAFTKSEIKRERIAEVTKEHLPAVYSQKIFVETRDFKSDKCSFSVYVDRVGRCRSDEMVRGKEYTPLCCSPSCCLPKEKSYGKLIVLRFRFL